MHQANTWRKTYNAAFSLAQCLESVRRQGNQVEHLIIDGGSTDGTLGIARGYRHIARIISESDNGIYDAMNQGLGQATGENL